MLVNLLHSPNASSPIEITELGIIIYVKNWPVNAYFSIEVTKLGIIVFLQPYNNLFVAVSIIALQLSLESNTGLLLSTTIDSNLLQYENIPVPIEVTELGIVIEVNLLIANAPLPIVVTEFGITIEVIPEYWNTELPIVVTESGILIEVKPLHW